MNSRIASDIRRIAQDRSHGASWLAREALRVLKGSVEENRAETAAGFLEDMSSISKELVSARPSMAPIANYIARFLYTVHLKGEEGVGGEALRNLAGLSLQRLLDDATQAIEQVAHHASELLQDGGKVLTCSYSSTVNRVFEVARDDGKNLYIIVAQSLSPQGIAYGKITARHLKAKGLTTEIIPDSSLTDGVSRADKVLVGADSVLKDGSIINGIPTLQVALAARERGVPVYCACEMAKLSPWSYLGLEVPLEEGFQRVPAELIQAIVTEEGVMQESSLSERWVEAFEYIRPFLAS
ncbi:MAG: hypothetical protein V3U90_03805 [Dehalococcoidia bacterium]